MFAESRTLVIFTSITAIVSFIASNTFGQNSLESSPVGTYLLFPDPLGPRSDSDCRDLVTKLKPSVKQAQQWLWGQMPNVNPAEAPFYIIITKSRMEPTFSGEGDYDIGNLSFGETNLGKTPFTLIPDDHPDVKIGGSILAKSDSEIVTVTLNAVPSDDGFKDRTVYYCRFDDDVASEI